MCWPYGDFITQINTIGNFRVVFDTLFPDLLPPSAIQIPQSLMENWTSHYETTILPAVENQANAGRVDDLLAVTSAPYDSDIPDSKESTIQHLLWYNVFATNDAAIKLGGETFDNRDKVYSGSSQDDQLNAEVKRFVADGAALVEIDLHYQTTGRLTRPVVTLHTTGDEIVPYGQATRYLEKITTEEKTALYDHFKIERYGHCNFESLEILTAFNRLVEMVAENP